MIIQYSSAWDKKNLKYQFRLIDNGRITTNGLDRGYFDHLVPNEYKVIL